MATTKNDGADSAPGAPDYSAIAQKLRHAAAGIRAQGPAVASAFADIVRIADEAADELDGGKAS